MNGILQWAKDTLQLNYEEQMFFIAIIAVFLVVCVFGALRKKAAFLIGFIVRMTAGVVSIVCINMLLSDNGVGVTLGVNAISLLTSAILGIPGVFLLYGMLFW